MQIHVNKRRKLPSLVNQKTDIYVFVFQQNNVPQTFSHKHLDIKSDFKLTFDHHLNNLLVQFNKTIVPLRELRHLLPRTMLITIYKAFVHSYLDYGDIL